MTTLALRAPAVLGRTAFDQLFEQFFQDPRPLVKRTTDGYPLTDVYRDQDDNQVIEMALAGFSKEDLEIQVKDNTITVGHQAPGPNSGKDFSQGRRIARRSFTKTFVDYYNTLDLAKSEANFENGLLVVTIPQLKDKKALSIEIK